MNSWDAVGASREPKFPLNVTCVGRLGTPLSSPIFCRIFETIHNPLSAKPCHLDPNVNSQDALGLYCVGTMGRLCMPLACIFCRLFETIHDPLTALLCPLGPNLNSWDALGASREPTFPVNVTIHDSLSAIPCHLLNNGNRLYRPNSVQRTHISRFCDLCEHNGQIGHIICYPIFCKFFETIHNALNALPCPLGTKL